MKKIILVEFPTHKFLGEEDVAPGRDASIEAIKSYVNEVFFITKFSTYFTYLLTLSLTYVLRIIYGL